MLQRVGATSAAAVCGKLTTSARLKSLNLGPFPTSRPDPEPSDIFLRVLLSSPPAWIFAIYINLVAQVIHRNPVILILHSWLERLLFFSLSVCLHLHHERP